MKKSYMQYLMALTGIFTGVAACFLPIKTYLIIIAAVGYVLFFIFDAQSALLFTLLIRSTVDKFSCEYINFPYLGTVNPAFFMGITVIALACIFYITGSIKHVAPNSGLFLLFLSIITIPTITTGVFSGYIIPGIQKLLKFVAQFSIYILIYNFAADNPLFKKKLLRTVILSALIPLFIGVTQIVTGGTNDYTEGFKRLTGTFVHPNPFAFYLLIVIASCLIYMFCVKLTSLFSSPLALLVLVVSFAELVMTYTRGAWLGFCVMVLISSIVTGRDFAGLYLQLMTGFALIMLPFVQKVKDRFTGLFSINTEKSSLSTRLHIWGKMIAVSFEHPLIGHGLGTFEHYAIGVLSWQICAHNEYLRLFFETGIFGLLSYLLLIAVTLNILLKKTIQLRGSRERAIPGIVFALSLSFSAMSIGDNIADNLVSQWYLWSLIALAVSVNMPFSCKGVRDFDENTFS